MLQLDDIISSEGEQEGVYVCIRENCERHDNLCEESTVDSLHEMLHPEDSKILPKSPPHSLGNCFVMWQIEAC